jgi:hypothetical protein
MIRTRRHFQISKQVFDAWSLMLSSPLLSDDAMTCENVKMTDWKKSAKLRTLLLKSQRHPSNLHLTAYWSQIVAQPTYFSFSPWRGLLDSLPGKSVTAITMKPPSSPSYNNWGILFTSSVSRKRSRAFVLLAFGLLIVYSILVSWYLVFSSQKLKQNQVKAYINVLSSPSGHTETELVATDSIFPSDSVSSSASPPFAIFYNIFIPPDGGKQGVRKALRIVKEQMNQVGESYAATSARQNNQTVTVYYNTIGHADALNATYMSHVCSKASKNMRCQHMQHYDQAYEEVTLERVKEYCHQHDSHKAIYMHSKGSYHSFGGRNEGWRRHMTMAVTDEHCLNPPNNTCNVCGLMLFVMPSFMFRGNFWAADCSYVNQLVPALDFEDRLRRVQETARQLQNQSQLLVKLQEDIDDNFGRGRYASEHWIGSHPSFRPCD